MSICRSWRSARRVKRMWPTRLVCTLDRGHAGQHRNTSLGVHWGSR